MAFLTIAEMKAEALAGQRKELEYRLKREVEHGSCELKWYEELSPPVIKELEEMGYSVIRHYRKKEFYYLISWRE